MESADGVIEQTVRFEEDTAEVLFDAGETTVEDIEDVLSDMGYPPSSHRLLDD